jgi:hypothetical protein
MFATCEALDSRFVDGVRQNGLPLEAVRASSGTVNRLTISQDFVNAREVGTEVGRIRNDKRLCFANPL